MKVEDYRNSMKVITKTLVAAIAVVAVGYWGSRLLHAQIRSAFRIPPLTIAFESLSSGGVSRELWEAYRRDSYPSLIEVTDITRGRYFVKDPLTKYFDEFPFVSALKIPLLQPPTSCREAVGPRGSCGADMGDPNALLGQRVEWGSLPVADGTALKLGFASDLGFLPLFRQKPSRGDDKPSTIQATSIIHGDPDPALFTLPDDYVKARSSAEFMSLVLKARGQAELTPDAADRMDRMQRDKWSEAQKRELEPVRPQ